MKIDGRLDFIGYIGINPIGTLTETAQILGKDLGIVFYEEQEGKYDEYPAFCAEALGLEFALLGIPDEEFDLREEKTVNFVLQVSSIKKEKRENRVDISAHIVDWLQTDSTIECWILK